MRETVETLTGWSRADDPTTSFPTVAGVRLGRRIRRLDLRRSVACLGAAVVGGGVAWNWASLLAGALHLGWLGPVAGLVAGVVIAGSIGTVDPVATRC
jgi:hypothetical protein